MGGGGIGKYIDGEADVLVAGEETKIVVLVECFVVEWSGVVVE